MASILKEATTPNSFKSLLSVSINVANPDAVVTLVISVALPTLVITRCKLFTLLPWDFTSCWYLLIKKIQLGIPITIINGGINAVSTVISYLSNPKKPSVHITPIQTTTKEINVALKDLKNKKKISDVTTKAAITNRLISSTMFCAFKVRI